MPDLILEKNTPPWPGSSPQGEGGLGTLREREREREIYISIYQDTHTRAAGRHPFKL